ncbi:heavy metal-responsive transcriptional regulator [Naumannella halotolerans]|uniref:DNA-binding transcriptional MerR regulator n=1 Tax=Naumannella halotolerans TaxID=993414 RepID=A0A4R7J197_9ACTN|nr:heavy metal-responsive transcriptional regulator [Naumannella halotolerans]TDT30911.1 DNA-binding transcriptional MerR regulator [Naumannella halotolerans]
MRIGEVSERTGVATSTIRYYEDQGLLPAPSRTASGYRDYGDRAVSRIRFVRQGQAAGLQLDEIAEILAIHDSGRAPCCRVTDLLQDRLSKVEQQIADLQALQANIRGLIGRAADDPEAGNAEAEICWLIEGTEPAPTSTAH